MGTMGLALSICTLPGKPPSDRLKPGEMEWGLGIHGEPGATKGPVVSAKEMVDKLLSTIVSPDTGYLPIKSGDQVVLLVNSLGATPPIELSVVVGCAVAWLRERGVQCVRVFSGALMTSLDMFGFSLTLLRADTERLARLDAPTAAPAWSPAKPCAESPALIPVPSGTEGAPPMATGAPTTPAGVAAGKAIRAACEALLKEEAKLQEWDQAVGDGDCGLTFARGANAILADLDTYPLDDPHGTAVRLGLSVRRSMGGTSGVLYDIFFTAAAAKFAESSPADSAGFAAGFRAGVTAMMKYGGASLGNRTMLDALLPAADALDSNASVADAAAAALAGAKSTQGMSAGAGRSTYVPAEALAANPDPGAYAGAFWLEAVAQALAA